MKIIAEYEDRISRSTLCKSLGCPRSTLYRSLKEPVPLRPKEKRPSPPRTLSLLEQQEVLATLNSDRFIDSSPAEVFATLLDEGQYLCSVRTMYRILIENGQSVIRYQSAPRSFKKPELLASQPGELWSWDITKLKAAQKWSYYYLYTIMDVFSRYVVGWLVAEKEDAELAKALIAEACLQQEIVPGTLTIHADRGASMTSKSVSQLMCDLGVARSHSRPHVSNDNPYSEAGFKTLKYHPGFPDRFGSLQDSREVCRNFYNWYNEEHHHSGIAMLTPKQVHSGMHEQVLKQRDIVLAQAYMNKKERFVKGMSKSNVLPEAVWINKPENKTESEIRENR